MKTTHTLIARLLLCVVLCLGLSACVTTGSDAVYYNPQLSNSHQVYGYNAVDFRALGVNY